MAKPETTGLSWRQAWFELLNGRKIKLPSWTGYWKWENNTIMMHCSDGTIIDIRETTNPAYTFTNIAENYWMIVSDDYEIENTEDELNNTFAKSNTESYVNKDNDKFKDYAKVDENSYTDTEYIKEFALDNISKG